MNLKAVKDAGQTLIYDTKSHGKEITDRMNQLSNVWEALQELAASRGQKLNESITFQKFLAKIEEEEAW